MSEATRTSALKRQWHVQLDAIAARLRAKIVASSSNVVGRLNAALLAVRLQCHHAARTPLADLRRLPQSQAAALPQAHSAPSTEADVAGSSAPAATKAASNGGGDVGSEISSPNHFTVHHLGRHPLLHRYSRTIVQFGNPHRYLGPLALHLASILYRDTSYHTQDSTQRPYQPFCTPSKLNHSTTPSPTASKRTSSPNTTAPP